MATKEHQELRQCRASAFAPAPDGQQFLVVEAIRDDEPRLIATLHWMPPRRVLD